LYRRHHRAHHRITPNQWTLRMVTRKNPTMTKICPKHYYGTITTPILMYTIIQLKQKNLSSCRFANTTPLQLQRIIIPKMRRTRSGKHSRRLCLMPRLRAHPQSYPRSLDAQHWRTSPFSPPEQCRCRREILVALCVLVSFRCVLYGLAFLIIRVYGINFSFFDIIYYILLFK